jgi:rhodanese-related sulfurtransferase
MKQSVIKNRVLECLQISILIYMVTLVNNVQAEDYISPESIIGSTQIDAESLIELSREKEDLVIIDSRIKSDRNQGHITGSISLPDTETDCASLLTKIDRKSTPTVFYCNGPKCRRSDRAVVIARDCGYENIYWFRGGFEEWNNKNYLISR